jgi:hypothetical protein
MLTHPCTLTLVSAGVDDSEILLGPPPGAVGPPPDTLLDAPATEKKKAAVLVKPVHKTTGVLEGSRRDIVPLLRLGKGKRVLAVLEMGVQKADQRGSSSSKGSKVRFYVHRALDTQKGERATTPNANYIYGVPVYPLWRFSAARDKVSGRTTWVCQVYDPDVEDLDENKGDVSFSDERAWGLVVATMENMGGVEPYCSQFAVSQGHHDERAWNGIGFGSGSSTLGKWKGMALAERGGGGCAEAPHAHGRVQTHTGARSTNKVAATTPDADADAAAATRRAFAVRVGVGTDPIMVLAFLMSHMRSSTAGLPGQSKELNVFDT